MSELAIDLGSATLRVWGADGELMREPAVVSAGRVRRGWGRSRRLLGHQALELARGAQPMALLRPMTEGVLTDPDAAELLLRAGLAVGRHRLRLGRPRVCFAVPALISDLQRRALRRLALDAGARGARAVASPLAVLAGLEVDVRAPSGHMVIDVGGGTTQVAVVALSSVVVSRALARGGDHMDRVLEQYLEQRFGARALPGAAEQLRMGLAGASASAQPLCASARDLANGAPRELQLHASELLAALAPLLDEIGALARAVLAQTPPELAADVADAGIVLCGGASQLAGLDQRLQQATGVPVLRVSDAIGAAARGCAALLCGPKASQELVTPL